MCQNICGGGADDTFDIERINKQQRLKVMARGFAVSSEHQCQECGEGTRKRASACLRSEGGLRGRRGTTQQQELLHCARRSERAQPESYKIIKSERGQRPYRTSELLCGSFDLSLYNERAITVITV